VRRREFIALVGASAAWPMAVDAQQTAKVARIGYLANLLAANPNGLEAFRQGLRDHGYVEGRNIVIEYRDAEGKLEQLPALAAELVALKVDVIVAGATLAARAAKQSTSTIPIVFVSAADPVASELVANPGRGKYASKTCDPQERAPLIHGSIEESPSERAEATRTCTTNRSRNMRGRGPPSSSRIRSRRSRRGWSSASR